MNLTTPLLTIRPVSITDSEALFAYRAIKSINTFLSQEPKSVDDVKDFIARSSKSFNVPGTWFQLALVEKETNTVIGDIGLHFLDTDPLNAQVEIGYTLHPNYHGKGFAFEALQAVISYLFKSLNKHRIVASVDPNNLPSIRLLKKLGFKKEGHFSKSLYFKGAWVDDVIFALLKQDWMQSKTQ